MWATRNNFGGALKLQSHKKLWATRFWCVLLKICLVAYWPAHTVIVGTTPSNSVEFVTHSITVLEGLAFE